MTSWSAGDKTRAVLPDGTYEGTVEAFNPSGHSALVALAAPVSRYPAGTLVPIPVRLLKAVS